MSQPPPLPPPARSRRFLWWLIPGAILLFLAVIVGFFHFVMSTMKRSEPHQLALAQIRSSAEVVRALGEPIDEGYFLRGNIHVSAYSGQAQFEIPLHGPKGSGIGYVAAHRSAGKWTFELLKVGIDGRESDIDLLPAPASASHP